MGERGGTPLLIRDLATVSVSAVPRQGTSGRDDQDEIVSGIVLMRKGENPSEVLASVKERVKDLNDNILPKGVKVSPFYDRSGLIDTTLHTVFKNLIEGALLVIIVLYLFLGNFRAAAIVALVIPLALLSTFAGLQLRALPANLLSLGAMDFGIIVDGAVIIMENIFRRLSGLQAMGDRETVRPAIIEAVAEVGRPTLFSMLIIITAHLPIFTLQRQEGRIFAPMAYTIVSALIGSLLFSVTLVPLLAYLMLRKGVPHEENIMVRSFKALYRPALLQAVKHPRDRDARGRGRAGRHPDAGAAAGQRIPARAERGLRMGEPSLPPGISVTQAVQECSRVRQHPEAVPRSALGRYPKPAGPKTAPTPSRSTWPSSWWTCIPKISGTAKSPRTNCSARCRNALEAVPGYRAELFAADPRQHPGEHFADRRPGGDQGLRRRYRNAAEIARERVLDTVRAVRGVNRAFIDRAGEVPQLQIEIDRAARGALRSERGRRRRT